MKIKYTGAGEASILYVTAGTLTVTKKPMDVPDVLGQELLENYPAIVEQADGEVNKLAMPEKVKGGE